MASDNDQMPGTTLETTSDEHLGPALGPVRPADRIGVVDALRGFALLGILLVNMELFRHPIYKTIMPPPADQGLADQVVSWLVTVLAEGKFYSMFSMLFGLGFALQFRRAEEREVSIVPIYLRRMAILLVFGLCHAFFLWTGDILVLYALLGFVLVLFRKARPRTLLIWIATILASYTILLGLTWAGLRYVASDPAIAAEIEETMAMEMTFDDDIQRAYDAYSFGSYAEVTRHRVGEYLGFTLMGLLGMTPSVFMLFLLGLYFGKRWFFDDIDAHRTFFRRLALVGAPIGLGLSVLVASMPHPALDLAGMSHLMLNLMVVSIGAPALSLAYVAGFALMRGHPASASLLRPLAFVGRMALTNYLLQSLICTTIFYGYGLGFFGQVGAVAGLGLTLLIFGGQVVASQWWLSRYRYGPAEWLWRSLTYMRRQPMRVGA